MLHSLKFRIIATLALLGMSVGLLTFIQYSFSSKAHQLFEAQLVIKELNVQYMKMEQAKTNYFFKHTESSIESFIVYSDTLDLYLEMVAEELEEFTYTEDLQNTLYDYQETFLSLTHSKSTNNSLLLDKLNTESKKIQYFIEEEQLRLIATITSKVSNIEKIQKFIYLLMFLLMILLLYNIFKPIINSIWVFKSFFSNYSSTHDRLQMKDLYFNEIKEIASYVNAMLEDQEEAQKVKDEFLSNMSHELRTPLNAIGGFAGVLMRKLPQEKEIITPIVESSEHLLQLVSDILDLSKIQSGKFEIVAEPFGLYGELEHLKNRFSAQMQKKDIDFNFVYEADENLRLMGDWFRVSQILNNFISNALKFTPENGEIKLHAKYSKGKLYLGVMDSGIGIEKDALKTILKPFEQSDKSVTKKFGGTGLGLSIAKTLTDMMDGTLTITSKVGQGSTFSVSIPFMELECERSEATQEEIQEENEEINFNIHVLVAEDNKTNQMLLEMLLDDLGITCDIANDGQEALDMFEEDKYAMVLMDENMPNLSGTESMLAIREKFENIPAIIAVTANAMKGDREKLIGLGMDDFLSKPIDNDLLIAVIKKNIRSK